MSSASSSSSHSSATSAGATVAILAFVGIFIWIQYTKRRWKNQLESFIEQHENDGHNNTESSSNNQGVQHQGNNNNNNNKRDILLIVNPASGGGKSIRLYPRILKELRRIASSGGDVHVIITKSSEEMKQLTQSKLSGSGSRSSLHLLRQSRRNDYHPISHYDVIAIMGGDSSITEFVQYELCRNGGKWTHAPILHLPTGTGNAISSECFGPCDEAKNTKLTIEELIRRGVTKSKLASVIQITSPNMTVNTTYYAVHNVFDGVQRHMLDTLDKFRGDLYPAFGGSIVIPLILASLFTFDASKTCIPYILAINTDTEGMGMQLNFGLSRFTSDKDKPQEMMIVQAKRWPGPIAFLQLFLNFMSGQLGKDFVEGNKKNLPSSDWFHMEKTNEFTLQPTTDDANDKKKKGHHPPKFHMYLDGGGTIPCHGTSLPVTFKVIPNAIPYFVHDDFDDINNNNNNRSDKNSNSKKDD